jgi:hypothetical protein
MYAVENIDCEPVALRIHNLFIAYKFCSFVNKRS